MHVEKRFEMVRHSGECVVNTALLLDFPKMIALELEVYLETPCANHDFSTQSNLLNPGLYGYCTEHPAGLCVETLNAMDIVVHARNTQKPHTCNKAKHMS